MKPPISPDREERPEISITIKFVGTLRSALNLRETKECYPEHTTIKQALHYMALKFGKKFEDEIVDLETDRLEPFLVVMINGQNALRLQGLQTILEDQDELLMIPPITGGSTQKIDLPTASIKLLTILP